jgi:ATP/maltotriose-dependent transcriptional regulator MalT
MELLLATKFFIPSIHTELVSRRRLIEKMNAGLPRKLTLISAPAGFGKTTLVSHWVEQLQANTLKNQNQNAQKIAWISLDENDNDLNRFLSYFIAALKRAGSISTTLEKSLTSTLQPLQTPPVRDILTAIINECASLSGRLITILDDYHVIASSQVNDALTFLIDHLPPQMHLIIITRDDPQLPLARIRAKSQMNEIRASDLRFTPSEIEEFLLLMLGTNFSSAELDLLDTHTEGWITELQLLAISMQGHEKIKDRIVNFGNRNRFVLDYLVEEVLEQQPEEIQEFLIQTSILKQLTGPLCNALTGQENGQQVLKRLEQANLFIIPLDHERCWYRYHHLFADLLHFRFQQTCADTASALHHRASVWLEQNNFLDGTVEHALQAEDFERATQLIFTHFDNLMHQIGSTKLSRWVDEMPEELILANPDLCILSAWFLFTRGNLDAAENRLDIADKLCLSSKDSQAAGSTHDPENIERFRIPGRVAAIRAFIRSYQGDIQGMVKSANQALRQLPIQDLHWRSAVAIALGDAYGMAGNMYAAYEARVKALETCKAGGNIHLILLSSMKLAVTVRMRGQLQRTIDICERQLYLANKNGVTQMAVVGWLFAIWAEVLAEINQIDEALIKGKKGIEITARSDNIALIGWSQMCLVRILFSRGNLDEAEDILRKLDYSSHDHHMPPYIAGKISAWQARILLTQNKVNEAIQWAKARNLSIERKITQLNEGEYIVFARILLAQGRTEDAIKLLQQLFKNAKAGDRIAIMIEVLILQALAFQASGDFERAMILLEQAISLAEPGGFVRSFVDEGPVMASLLYEAIKRQLNPQYTQRLLSAFSTSETAQKAASELKMPASGELLEPLSEREIEVLHLVAKGLQRQEIAENLVLSLNTVKSHLRNIFRKLGVNNQMQAVAKARNMGFLDIE